MYKKLKRIIFKLLLPSYRLYKFVMLKIYIVTHSDINIIVGAGDTKQKGWYPTDIHVLNLAKEKDFRRFFKKKNK